MEEIKTFSEVFSVAATAIADAVKEYGPEAVDLGLIIYQLEGIKVVVTGVLLTLAALFIAYRLYRFTVDKQIPWVKAQKSVWDDREMSFLFTGLLTIPVIFILAVGLSKVLSVYHWAAAIGYPEVLIAYKALVAAGVM